MTKFMNSSKPCEYRQPGLSCAQLCAYPERSLNAYAQLFVQPYGNFLPSLQKLKDSVDWRQKDLTTAAAATTSSAHDTG